MRNSNSGFSHAIARLFASNCIAASILTTRLEARRQRSAGF
jgi:hypothetical protein